ncbi:hypothetical protein V6N13_134579 [Hibiscus sabdariffa]
MLIKTEQEHKARSPFPADTTQTGQLLVQERTSKRKIYIDVQIRMDVIAISKLRIMLSPSILHMMITSLPKILSIPLAIT